MEEKSQNTKIAEIAQQEARDAQTKPAQKALELRDVRTVEMFFSYLKQNKVKDLNNALVHTFLLSQKPVNCIYIVHSAGVNLGLLQQVASVLNQKDFGSKLISFKAIEFLFGKKRYVIAKNETEEKDKLEKMQGDTGGVTSDVINDVGIVRIIYLHKEGYNLSPVASDCSLYEMLQE